MHLVFSSFTRSDWRVTVIAMLQPIKSDVLQRFKNVKQVITKSYKVQKKKTELGTDLSLALRLGSKNESEQREEVEVICEDGEVVLVDKLTMLVYSPLFRECYLSVRCCTTVNFSLPDFSGDSIRAILSLLKDKAVNLNKISRRGTDCVRDILETSKALGIDFKDLRVDEVDADCPDLSATLIENNSNLANNYERDNDKCVTKDPKRNNEKLLEENVEQPFRKTEALPGIMPLTKPNVLKGGKGKLLTDSQYIKMGGEVESEAEESFDENYDIRMDLDMNESKIAESIPTNSMINVEHINESGDEDSSSSSESSSDYSDDEDSEDDTEEVPYHPPATLDVQPHHLKQKVLLPNEDNDEVPNGLEVVDEFIRDEFSRANRKSNPEDNVSKINNLDEIIRIRSREINAIQQDLESSTFNVNNERGVSGKLTDQRRSSNDNAKGSEIQNEENNSKRSSGGITAHQKELGTHIDENKTAAVQCNKSTLKSQGNGSKTSKEQENFQKLYPMEHSIFSSEQTLHTSEKNSFEAKFTCTVCNEVLGKFSASHMKEHFSTKHFKKEIFDRYIKDYSVTVCPECGKDFGEKQKLNLVRHLGSTHNKCIEFLEEKGISVPEILQSYKSLTHPSNSLKENGNTKSVDSVVPSRNLVIPPQVQSSFSNSTSNFEKKNSPVKVLKPSVIKEENNYLKSLPVSSIKTEVKTEPEDVPDPMDDDDAYPELPEDYMEQFKCTMCPTIMGKASTSAFKEHYSVAHFRSEIFENFLGGDSKLSRCPEPDCGREFGKNRSNLVRHLGSTHNKCIEIMVAKGIQVPKVFSNFLTDLRKRQSDVSLDNAPKKRKGDWTDSIPQFSVQSRSDSSSRGSEDSHKCPFCDYSSKHNLKRHIQSQHSDVT